MVLCVSCGEDNPEGTHYCLNCGVELGYAHVPTPRPEIVIDDVPPPDDVAQRVREAAGQPLSAEVDPLAGPAGIEVDARNEPAVDQRVQPGARPPAQPTTSPARLPPQGPDPDLRAPSERPDPDLRAPSERPDPDLRAPSERPDPDLRAPTERREPDSRTPPAR